jgi:alkanesulfonate monooxygenase SsuD/methylene tetrahydromethanopterin reductase-like flavin-dependent oxidoreductase (luciferase family)
MQCGLFYQLPCAPGQDAVTRYQETMEQIVYAEELDVGRGTIAIHFQGFNVPVEESRARFEEALTILERAWTQEACTFAGRYFQVREAPVVPTLLQHPHPPLRLAANSLETAAFAGARSYPVCVACVINPFPKLPEQIDLYRHAFQAAGHTGRQANVVEMFPVYVADSAALVRHEVEPSLMYCYRTVAEQLRLGEPNPSPSYRYLRQGRKHMEAITWEEAEATMALYGSPEQCVQKLRKAHARCGMD